MQDASHRFVDLNGQSFHYLEWGRADAPVLLFLHGFPEYSGAWSEVATRLADSYHCIAPDQRGFGQSWAPPEVSAYFGLPAVEAGRLNVSEVEGERVVWRGGQGTAQEALDGLVEEWTIIFEDEGKI